MAVPPDSKSNWNTGSTQRLPTRSISVAAERVPHRPRSRRATCGIIAISTLIGVLVVGLGVGSWAWNKYQTAAERFTVQLPERFTPNNGNPNNPQQPVIGTSPRPTPDIVKEPFNILLVGVDVREDMSDARTDTIIVLHIDPQQKWATMLSIPRDSCAEIPGYYDNGDCWKINAAYERGYADSPLKDAEGRAIGGLTLTRDTVEQYLNLPARGQKIDYVAQVDFNGFRKIIDSLGGINLNVPKPLWDPVYPSDDNDNGFIRLHIPAGYQHMNGTTALRYARSRHQDTDYGRSQRQQDVIRAIIQAIKEKGLFDQIEQLDQLAKDLEGYVFTDLPITDVGNLRALAGLGSDLAKGQLQSLKWDTSTVVGGPDINTPRWDPASIDATVDALLSGPIPNTNQTVVPTLPSAEPNATVTIEVMNGASIRGLAGDVKTYLSNRGYATSAASTASAVYDTTMIIDYGANVETRNQLAALLGLKPKQIILASRAPEQPTDPASDLVLLLGRDYQEAWRNP